MNNLNLRFGWDTVRKLVVWITILVLGYALIQYEKVNFDTTYESLAGLFGDGRWVRILAEAVVITDLAALARVFTVETGKDEPVIVKVLLGIWVAVTALDAGLTYFFAAVAMENTAVVAPAAMRPFLNLFPVLVAILVWGIQGGLLYLFGKLLEGAIHGKGKQKAQHVNHNNNGHVPNKVSNKVLHGAAAAAARYNAGGKVQAKPAKEPQYKDMAQLARDMGLGRGNSDEVDFQL